MKRIVIIPQVEKILNQRSPFTDSRGMTDAIICHMADAMAM
jgi:hypothetical protein